MEQPSRVTKKGNGLCPTSSIIKRFSHTFFPTQPFATVSVRSCLCHPMDTWLRSAGTGVARGYVALQKEQLEVSSWLTRDATDYPEDKTRHSGIPCACMKHWCRQMDAPLGTRLCRKALETSLVRRQEGGWAEMCGCQASLPRGIFCMTGAIVGVHLLATSPWRAVVQLSSCPCCPCSQG